MSTQYIINNSDNLLTGQTITGDLTVTTSLSASTFYGDASNMTGISTPTYKVYTALMSQSATSNPTANVLENTLDGDITWTYSADGIYIGSLSSAFTLNKTVIFLQKKTTLSSVSIPPKDVVSYRTSDDTVIISTMDDTNFINDVLSDHAIEIRVYN